MRVLLVEDYLVSAQNIATAIEDEVWLCDSCATSSEALEFLRQIRYSVAVLDYNLQRENSLFLASHLRLRHPEIKIVTITGSPLLTCGYGLDRLGTDFLFRKPFAMSDLVGVVKHLRTTSCPQRSEGLARHHNVAKRRQPAAEIPVCTGQTGPVRAISVILTSQFAAKRTK